MYTENFDLKRNPFDAQSAAADPFVGDRQAKVGRRLGNALSTPDAVVAVSGAVGVGKTTLVNRIIQAVPGDKVVASVGRVRMGPDDVLELLLQEFELQQEPQGTIQKFATFRRLLKEFTAAGKRVFIVVEDARRVGADALLELESLTAAENNELPGASIVLMGQPDLTDLLSSPELARLSQRIRMRQAIDPLTASEVPAYLHHLMTLAGGDYGSFICTGTAEVLHSYSGGIPRVINNLLESTLTTAADAGLKRVAPQLVAKIATDVFGLTPVTPLAMPPPPTPITEQSEPEPIVDALPNDTEPTAIQEIPSLDDLQSAASAEDEQDMPSFTETDIPMLSDSMRIDKADLLPKPPTAVAESEPKSEDTAVESEPEPDPVPVAKFEPMLAPEPQISVETPAEETAVPEVTVPERPTGAGPDLDALEAAISAARGDNPVDETTSPGTPEPEPADAAMSDVPELILDKFLEDQRSGNPDLEKIVIELSKVENLEDIDDIMAETLFGNDDLNEISAHIVANPPPANMNDVNPSSELDTDPEPPSKPEPLPDPIGHELPEIKITLGEEAPEPPPPAAVHAESIEDQIDTAITQTQKVLTAADIPEEMRNYDADEEENQSTGLFGMFKRP